MTARSSSAAPPSRRVRLVATDEPLASVAARLGREARIPVAVAPAIRARPVTFDHCLAPVREAIEDLARKTRTRIEDLPGGGVWLEPADDLTLHADPIDLRVALERIARCADEPVIVHPDVQGVVSFSLWELPWRDALAVVAHTFGLEVGRGCGFTVVGLPPLPLTRARGTPPAATGSRVDVRANAAPPAEVAYEIGRIAGKNVLVDPWIDTPSKEDLLVVKAGVVRPRQPDARIEAAALPRPTLDVPAPTVIPDDDGALERRLGALAHVTAVLVTDDPPRSAYAIVGGEVVCEGDGVVMAYVPAQRPAARASS